MKYSILIAVLLVMALPLCAEVNITDELLPSYFHIREKLAGDSLEGVREAAATLIAQADRFLKNPDADPDLAGEVEIIGKQAAGVKSGDIKQAREAFKELSKAMIRLHGKAPGKTSVVTFYCSMAPGSWLQEKDDIGNPYYGSEMLRCGKKIVSRAPEPR